MRQWLGRHVHPAGRVSSEELGSGSVASPWARRLFCPISKTKLERLRGLGFVDSAAHLATCSMANIDHATSRTMLNLLHVLRHFAE